MNIPFSAFAGSKRLITPYGLKLLKQYVLYLKTKQTKELEELRIAREHGDFRENAEFQTAKENTRIITSRLDEIEPMLSYQVTASPPDKSIIRFGATVTLLKDENEICVYTIGSGVEAVLCTEIANEGVVATEAAREMISYDAPMGQALLMQRIGSVVNVRGSTYKVTAIEY
jgi:transcription elongation factor GreA